MGELEIDISEVRDILNLSGNTLNLLSNTEFGVVEDIVTVTQSEHPISVVKNKIFNVNIHQYKMSIVMIFAMMYGCIKYNPNVLGLFKFTNTDVPYNLRLLKCMYSQIYDKYTIPTDMEIINLIHHINSHSREWGLL